MKYGRTNIIAGGIVIFAAAIGGFALGFTMNAYFEKGFYAIPLTRLLLKAGHTHGMPFALYNLLVGSLVDRMALDDKWKKICSVAAVLAFVMPLGLILRGLTGGAMTFAPVVALGALFFLISVGVLIKGAVSNSTAKENIWG